MIEAVVVCAAEGVNEEEDSVVLPFVEMIVGFCLHAEVEFGEPCVKSFHKSVE